MKFYKRPGYDYGKIEVEKSKNLLNKSKYSSIINHDDSDSILAEDQLIKMAESAKFYDSFKKLNEERGVGCSPEYLKIVEEIVDYVEKYVQEHPADKTVENPDKDRPCYIPDEDRDYYNRNYGDYLNQWNFKIPQQISSKFDISNLTINVTITDFYHVIFDWERSAGYIDFPELLDDLQLKKDEDNNPIHDLMNSHKDIHIDAYSVKKKLNRRVVFEILVHEINHYIDHYNRAKHGESTFYKNSPGVQGIEYNALCKIMNNGKHPFYPFFYYLFSATELNALIASVYGELKEYYKQRDPINYRKSFKRDFLNVGGFKEYTHCFAYFIYLECKNMLESIKSPEDEDDRQRIDRFFQVINTLFWREKNKNRLLSISPVANFRYKPTPEQFKKAFIAKAERCLDKLIKGIGRVASYFYDQLEDNKPK